MTIELVHLSKDGLILSREAYTGELKNAGILSLVLASVSERPERQQGSGGKAGRAGEVFRIDVDEETIYEVMWGDRDGEEVVVRLPLRRSILERLGDGGEE